MAIKHYKTRNTLLLFEILISKFIAEMKDPHSTHPSLHIMKKYFSKNTELSKDLKICETLSENTSNINPSDVDKYVMEIIERDNVDAKLLKDEHYKLCGEIKENYDIKKFLSTDVKNYITIASVYKLLSFYREGSLNVMENVKDRLVYENHIKTILTLPPKDKSKNIDRLNEMTQFERSMLPVSFRKKYEGVLTNEQIVVVWKGLKKDVKFLQEEAQKLSTQLNESILNVGEKLKEKIEEGLDKIQNLSFDSEHPEQFESNVKAIIHTHSLINEITKLNDISK